MSQETVHSYCRICEACCGLTLKLEDGRIRSIQGDPDHPTSLGYLCPKGASMIDVVYDDDRVLHPMKRMGGPGEFERVTWDEALDDIAARCRKILDRDGGSAIGMYYGQPGGFNMAHSTWSKKFMDAVGSTHNFSVASQDSLSRSLASYHLYGAPSLFPLPDLDHTAFLLIIGANPLVSHGSLLSVGRIREKLQGIKGRGGRIVVVDPARTKTAKAYEHIPVRPGSDPWLLGAMLNEIFERGLEDRVALAAQAEGTGVLREALAPLTVSRASQTTGLPAADIVALAEAFATAPSAVAYGRLGACRGRVPTLTNYLIDALSVVTGNFDRRGGLTFGAGIIDYPTLLAKLKRNTVGTHRTRVGNFPDLTGRMPYVLPQEITTQGVGQIKALFVSAGNPVSSAPDGDALEAALQYLELHVSLDLYITETNRHADYVLPATTFFERTDVLLYFGGNMPNPWIQASAPAIQPLGEAKEEWWVYDELMRLLDLPRPPSGPLEMIDHMIRTSPLGEKEGWTVDKVLAEPHGILLADEVPVGVARDKLRAWFGGRTDKVQLGAQDVLDEVSLLVREDSTDPDRPLLLIGRRELRSMNSWMHNVRAMKAGGPVPTLHIHPSDAHLYGIDDLADVQVSSRSGSLVVRAEITEDIAPGTVSYPHGWGHRGGWHIAIAHGGANINRIVPNALDAKEPLSGMSQMDGIAVAVAPLLRLSPEV